MSEQGLYTAAQLEILRHVGKHGALPQGVNHDDVAKLRQWHLMRLENIIDGVGFYNLRPAGYEAIYATSEPTDDLARLQDENARLREALAWYAEENNYNLFHDPNADSEYATTQVNIDDGERARKALEGGE